MPQITTPKNIPQVKVYKHEISHFRGVDLTNQPASVHESRACDGLNMIRDVPGKVRKRMGYYKRREYDGRINGLHERRGELIVHAGTKLYRDGETPTLLYDGMADARSYGIQFDGKLLLLDGQTYLIYDGETVKPASDGAYIPTVSIARSPNGGGTAYEPVNMLQRKRTDSFLGTESDTVYQLSFETIATDTVTAQKRDEAGDWTDLMEGTDFSVDRATGKVTFTSSPGVSPVTGEDNVRVTYAIDNAEYQNRVNGCTFMIAYGAYGAMDRVFLSGYSELPNYDFFSDINDPTYMGDINYGVLGQDHSPITGYSIINNRLATHKRRDDNERNIFLRYGEIDRNNEPENDGVVFPIVDIIQGPGAVSPYTFGYAKEPIFLTGEGICATTPYEFNSERYVQNRSFYLNGALLNETGMDSGSATVYKEMYLLAVNGKVYILDTVQTAEAAGERSAYQYEGYLWDNIPARCLFTNGDVLLFGDDVGNLYAFYTDTESLLSYSDEGKAIPARWDVDFSGSEFYLKKRIRFLSVRMSAAAATSVDVWVRVRGLWQKLADSGAKARFWSYANFVYSKMTYSNDPNPRTVGKKVKVKKFDAVRLSFRNEELNEPFGLLEMALEYTQTGYYKR